MIRREWESIVFQPVREDVPSPHAYRASFFVYFAGIDIADRPGVYSRRGQMGRFIGRSRNSSRTGKSKFLSITQHAKYFIVDGEDVYLGSQNFDWRALKHIYELGVRITDKRAAKAFTDIFEIDWKLSGPESKSIKIPWKRYKIPYLVIGGDDPLTGKGAISIMGEISAWSSKI